jgi:protein-S-isoprenylcysteine O-methyltransferase Ste14
MCFLSIFPLAGLLIIALLIFIKVRALRKQGIKVSAKGTKKKPAFLLVYPVFLLLFMIWLWGLAESALHLQQPVLPSFLTKRIIESYILEATGAGFIFLSVILMLFTLLHFKSSLRFGLSKNNPGKLITTGIFSLTRNPFFLSIDLFFIGQAMVIPAPLFIAMAFMALLSIHLFILKEERFMHVQYPEEYPSYSRKVRRYL